MLLASPVRADLVVVGSSTILPAAKRVGEAFTAETGIRIKFSGGGSGRGVSDATSGRADIGMVSRALHADEARTLVATSFALDAVAVFVNERNPVAGLTHAQVAGIYRGRLAHWRDLSRTASAADAAQVAQVAHAAKAPHTAEALEGAIYPVGKLHGRSTRELFDGFFKLAGQEYPKGTHLIGSNVAGILYVSIDPQAIGYVSVGSLSHAARHGAPVKTLPLDGVAPTPENVQSGRYPYARPLNLVTRGQPRGEAARFIAWMLGPAGQQAARDEGFLLQGDENQPAAADQVPATLPPPGPPPGPRVAKP